MFLTGLVEITGKKETSIYRYSPSNSFLTGVYLHPFKRFVNIEDMASATTKAPCSTCNKKKYTYKCSGCLENFCYDDLNEHRLLLEKQYDEIETDHNQFRQILNQQMRSRFY